MPESAFQPYSILQPLESGGMADVFLARRETTGGLGKLVVLKRLKEAYRKDAEIVRLFEREAKLTMAMEHPNLVAVLDYFEQEGASVLVMEHINGLSLRSFLEALKRDLLPDEEKFGIILLIALQLLQAVRFLHERKEGAIVHRDIKPGNVMIDVHGVVKLLDFGIAKPLSPLENLHDQPMTAPLGTARYAAPEREIEAEAMVGEDIYSIGVILHELCALFKKAESCKPLIAPAEEMTRHRAHSRPTAKEAHAMLLTLLPESESILQERLGALVQAMATDAMKLHENAKTTGTTPIQSKQTKKLTLTPKGEAAELFKGETKPKNARKSRAIAESVLFKTMVFLAFLGAVAVFVFWSMPKEEGKFAFAPTTKPTQKEKDKIFLAFVPIDAHPERIVLLDGEKWGETPLVVKTTPGRHELSLLPKGKEGEEDAISIERTIFLVPGANGEIYVK